MIFETIFGVFSKQLKISIFTKKNIFYKRKMLRVYFLTISKRNIFEKVSAKITHLEKFCCSYIRYIIYQKCIYKNVI